MSSLHDVMMAAASVAAMPAKMSVDFGVEPDDMCVSFIIVVFADVCARVHCSSLFVGIAHAFL